MKKAIATAPNKKTKYVNLSKKELEEFKKEQAKFEADKKIYEETQAYKDKRMQAYVEAGATVDGVLEALFEMIVEGRPEKAQAMKIKRQEIKDLFPKPKG